MSKHQTLKIDVFKLLAFLCLSYNLTDLLASYFQTIKIQLPVKTSAQREVKNNFAITKKEREMLIEL